MRREGRDHQVRHGGAIAAPVLQLGDMGAPHRRHGQRAEGGQDVVVDRRTVLRRRRRLAAHRHMLAKIAARERGNGGFGGCRFGGRGFGGCGFGEREGARPGVRSRLDAGDDRRRAPARLVGGDDPVPAEGDPPRAVRPPALHDIDLRARGLDPHPETGQVPVPEHGVLLDGQRLHAACRDRVRVQLRHCAIVSVPGGPFASALSVFPCAWSGSYRVMSPVFLPGLFRVFPALPIRRWPGCSVRLFRSLFV